MDSQPSKEAPPPEPTPKRPSQDSQDAFGTDSDVDASSSDMDGIGEGYRRRRAQLMAGLENGHARGKGHRKHSRRQHRETAGTPNGEGKYVGYSSDESSEYSSRSTSDDVELSHLAPDDALQDDEETGLTKKNKEHRKRRRRKATRLDGRIGGNIKTSKQEQKVADWECTQGNDHQYCSYSVVVPLLPLNINSKCIPNEEHWPLLTSAVVQ